MTSLFKGVFASVAVVFAAGFASGEWYDTSAYVQEGLIAHWDAVENVGRGRSQGASTSWKDITCNHGDLVFPNGCVRGVNANGAPYYNLAKDAEGKDHGCWLSSCADVAQALVNKNCTIEIVCDFASRVDEGALIAVLDGDTSKRFLAVRSNQGVAIGCIGSGEYLASAWTGSLPKIDSDSKSFNFVRTYTMLAGDSCAFYRNGQHTWMYMLPGTGNNALIGADPQRASLSLGFRRTASETAAETEVSDMKIYAVRIYDRQLSWKELQENYSVDNARFILGQFEEGVGFEHYLKIESEPEGLEGSAFSPAVGTYEGTPGEEKVCSAAASLETDSYRMTCLGYQLYTNTLIDATSWFPWGGPQEGNSAAFQLPAEAGAKLVWRCHIDEVKISVASRVLKSFGAGKDSVFVQYRLDAFSLPQLRVALRYGTTPKELDGFVAGQAVSEGGTHVDVFGGLDSGRSYWGKLVFTVGDHVVSETSTFAFATTERFAERFAYWPLNSRNLVWVADGTAHYSDQSGNGYELTASQEHVQLVSGSDATDGEFARLDGNGAYLKTSSSLPLSDAEGLTFSFRLRGVTNEGIILETSSNYNNNNGALMVETLKEQDGKLYLYVGEKSSKGFAYCKCGTPLAEAAWQSVCIVFTKQDAPDCIAVYIDGVRCVVEPVYGHNKSMAGQRYSDDRLYIGGRNGTGTMVGDLDELSVFKFALDMDEAMRLTAGMTGGDGSLFVEVTDAGKGVSDPVVGAHRGYKKGEVVSFGRLDADGDARQWTLYDANQADGRWNVVKRGYGHCGKFTHTGGRMRLCWDVDMTRRDDLKPICRWTFEDQTGRNEGSIGADGDLEFSGKTTANDRYLAVPAEPDAFASTKSALQLASADGLTLGFCLRNPVKRSDTMLFELSQDFNKNTGCFIVMRDSTDGHWELCLGGGRYNVVLCNPNEYTDRIADGNWHYCTFVVRKDAWPNLDLYIDGVLMPASNGGFAFDASSFTFANDQKLWLCHRNSSNTQKADIDNVTLYPRAFSAAEVDALCSYESRVGASLVVTAKTTVPIDDLPIPGFGTVCPCTAGEKLSFDFTRGPYTVEGSQGKYRLMGWKIYRFVDGEWTEHAKGSNALVEFIHPGGRVKLELNFGVPGLAIVIN